MSELLRVEHLRTSFATDRGVVRAVDDVDLALDQGQDARARRRVRLREVRDGVVDHGPDRGAGRIEPDRASCSGGRDLVELDDEELRRIRGNELSMIFQEPMTSLNPVFTVGWQITAIDDHGRVW